MSVIGMLQDEAMADRAPCTAALTTSLVAPPSCTQGMQAGGGHTWGGRRGGECVAYGMLRPLLGAGGSHLELRLLPRVCHAARDPHLVVVHGVVCYLVAVGVHAPQQGAVCRRKQQ